jgi:Protein of unknown function (DUF2795)
VTHAPQRASAFRQCRTWLNRAKKNPAGARVLDIVGAMPDQDYRTMADVMKGFGKAQWAEPKPLDFDPGTELDDTLRRDQEVIRGADGVAHHEGVDPFLPQRHLGLQGRYGHLPPEKE